MPGDLVESMSARCWLPWWTAVSGVQTFGRHLLMFVERSSRDGEEIVVLRYAAAFYWLMWPSLGLTIVASMRSSVAINVATAVAWVLLLAVAVPYWPVIWRLKKQMSDSSITASGSKYSFTNPLTYRWRQVENDQADG